MERNGISKLDLKRLNRAEILRLITKNGPMSRIDISYSLHLTRAAVTIITNEMISQGIIYEKGEEKTMQKASRGRKKILLDICENYKFSFGVVIDRNKVSIGLANIKGQTLQKDMIDLKEESIDSIILLICNEIKYILSQNYLTEEDLIGIAICISDNALPLFDNTSKENAIKTTQVLVKKKFTIPVLVEGTTESLAIAEMVFNDEVHNYSGNIVFVRYGYDTDAAIMIGENIYKGSSNNAGWFSHLVVDPKGDRCSCGKRGCLITKLSVQSIVEKTKQLYTSGQAPILFEKTNGDINKVDFSVNNLKNLQEDESIKTLYQNTLRYFLAALDNISIVLDPDKIVIFGYAFEKIWDLDQLKQLMAESIDNQDVDKKANLPENYVKLIEKLMLSSIYDSNIHLAGNGLCVKKLFVNTGGY